MTLQRHQPIGGSSKAEREGLRDRAEAAARARHPKATEIRVNAAHPDGPFVDVFGDGEPENYRFTGWELPT